MVVGLAHRHGQIQVPVAVHVAQRAAEAVEALGAGPARGQGALGVQVDLHPAGLLPLAVAQKTRHGHVHVAVAVDVPQGQVAEVVVPLGALGRGLVQDPRLVAVPHDRARGDVVPVGHDQVRVAVAVHVRPAHASGHARVRGLPHRTVQLGPA